MTPVPPNLSPPRYRRTADARPAQDRHRRARRGSASTAALVVVNERTPPPSAAELREARADVYEQLDDREPHHARVIVEPDGHDAYARIEWPDGSGAGIELRRSGDGWRLAHDPACVSPDCGP